MADLPNTLKKQFNRLLMLLHEQTPEHRPSAEQARQVSMHDKMHTCTHAQVFDLVAMGGD
jgi:hypothetical protein